MRKILRSFLAFMLCFTALTASNAQTTFRQLLDGGSASNGTITMPENAQVLKMYSSRILLWDGTAGLLLYIDDISSKFTNMEYGSAYWDGYTGYSISGTINAVYEDTYYDFYADYNSVGNLTFGSKGTLTPKEVTGAEAANTDRSNFYCYVKMHGTMNGNNFTADDGTVFTINEEFNTGVIGKSGAGTIKAVVGNISQANSMSVLTIIENGAWTTDPTEQDFQGEVMTLGALKQKNYETVRFKFEEDKVQVVSLSSSYGFDQMYLWDGNDGLLVNGYILANVIGDTEFSQGQVVNGGIEANYNGSYGNSMYFSPDYGHEAIFKKGNVQSLIPKKTTVEAVHATVNTSTYEFSYVALPGKIENGALVSGDISIPIALDVCPTADLTKYEGQTGTFYGLYNSRNMESVMPISEYYFMKADDPIVEENEVANIDELWNAEANKVYTMKLAPESDYKVQVLAYTGPIVYLWDGQNGLIAIDESESFDPDDFGRYIYGDVEFSISDEYGTKEFIINYSTINQLSAAEDFFPAVEKIEMREGDFVKMHVTIEADETETPAMPVVTYNGETYMLVDDILGLEIGLDSYIGKTGILTAIYAGEDANWKYLSIYDENWFTEDAVQLPEVASLEEVQNLTEDGDYILNVPTDGSYTLQVLAVNGDKMYLYDGQTVYRFDYQETLAAPRKAMKAAPAEMVGAMLQGEIKIRKEGDVVSIDGSSVTVGEVTELLPPVETETVLSLYGYITVTGMVEKGFDITNNEYYYVVLDDMQYILSDELITMDKLFSELVGQTGKMSLLVDGINAYAYPEGWFVADYTSIEGVETSASAKNIYTIDGRKVVDGQMQKGIYIVNGKKVVK